MCFQPYWFPNIVTDNVVYIITIVLQPLFIMANKTDIVTKDELSDENKQIFDQLEKDGVGIFWTSTGMQFSFCVYLNE